MRIDKMNFATKNQMNNCSIRKMHRQLKIMPILDKAPFHDIPLPFFYRSCGKYDSKLYPRKLVVQHSLVYDRNRIFGRNFRPDTAEIFGRKFRPTRRTFGQVKSE